MRHLKCLGTGSEAVLARWRSQIRCNASSIHPNFKPLKMSTSTQTQPTTTWDGTAHSDGPVRKGVSGTASQQEFMMKDTCIVVDENDRIVGNRSKKDCHIFSAAQSGILHRAFSVFLFDEEKRLLLQQRASHKFTFPDHWTNTCCSHPLFGFDPSEVDTPEEIQRGTVTGIKRAAIRKLGHELGISASELDIQDFKYLTRLHYCASDVEREGEDWTWGEHEMDYILFLQKPVHLSVNPEEVCDHRYVTRPELRAMMAAESGMKWTPWFRIIVQNFLDLWWGDLDALLKSDQYVDYEKIHCLNV